VWGPSKGPRFDWQPKMISAAGAIRGALHQHAAFGYGQDRLSSRGIVRDLEEPGRDLRAEVGEPVEDARPGIAVE